MSYFSTKIIKCVISRVLLLNVEYSYYPFGIFLGGSGGPEVRTSGPCERSPLIGIYTDGLVQDNDACVLGTALRDATEMCLEIQD